MRRERPLLMIVPLVVLALAISGPVWAASNKTKPHDPAAVERLRSQTGAQVALSDATGTARFVRVPKGRALGQAKAGKAEHALAFLDSHGRAFGVRDARSELKLVTTATDRWGGSHFTYSQDHRGVPVFGAMLKAHYDPQGNLSAVNGTLVPDIDVDVAPRRSAQEVGAAALGDVAGGATVRSSHLVIFREGLAKGVPGDNHLAYEVEVGNGADIREFVFVDAHSGKVIDRFSGIHDALNRRAYDAMGLTAPGPNYPATPFWQEGDPFPTGTAEADNMIAASAETYDLFSKAFGRDSFDGAGATMDSIFNRGNGCPNASWNGIFISFCPGVTTDDVTAHEWGHAYTQYTHNLIYQWQPGALNEAYSDIWGETVDLINGRGLDSPNALRTANACTAFTPPPPVLTINSPASIAGNYTAGSAAFGAPLTPAGLTGDVVLANDGVGGPNPPSGAVGDLSVMDGCETPFANAAALAGKIAMVYRGNCPFTQKSKNAQVNGAIGVIVANHAIGGNGAPGMAGVDPTITVPVLSVGNADGELIRAQLGGTVNATLRAGATAPDNSYRWLVGEESTGFGGAIRDMWNPTCYGNAGKVTDAQYTCSTGDNGGVHSNSGIPNHAFALLVDGGTYNGHTVAPLGLTKAAHIYYRAQTVYQGPASVFADHADALEASCSDLIGVNLTDIVTGAPSGQSLTASDCEQIHHAAEAVELRTPPTQCNFVPILAKNPPPLCTAGTSAKDLFRDNFENGDSSLDRWIRGRSGTTADFTPRDWTIASDLPDDRAGKAFFGPNPDIGTCAPGGDETAALHLTSPPISIPASNTNLNLTFDHWLATEPGWDGGNLKISVNGGPWQLVQPADFVYNPYNRTLFTAGQGNTNPLAGEGAFSGTDGGSVEGSWGRSIVNLSSYAGPQDKVRLRFDIGNDGCTGRFGWYVDDVKVYTCR